MFTLGLDAEFFIIDINGHIIAPSMLKQSTINEINRHDNLSIDGIHLEINPSAYECREDATRSVKKCMLDLKEILQKENYLVSPEISRKFTPATFKKLTDGDKKLGCKPSYNTYIGGISHIPNNAERLRFRSAGGHLHFGSPIIKQIEKDFKIPVKLLDLFVGVPIALLENETERRRIYGKAGEYRPTEYGIEYRVASSLIIRDPSLYSMFLGWGRAALELAELYYQHEEERESTLKILHDLVEIPDEEIQDAINNCNKKLLKKLFISGIVKTYKSYPSQKYKDIKEHNSIYKKSIIWYLYLLLNQPKRVSDPNAIWDNWSKYTNRNGIDTELSKVKYSSSFLKSIKNKWRKFAT